MDDEVRSGSESYSYERQREGAMDIRKGPWAVQEDTELANYVHAHGEGRWNSVARCAGLKRTGKSCRLRWLNYLRPDVRRGNITHHEQLLILDLHSRWGNRWSKIAQQLPGRTDNEIKNYWRTRVIKQAKHLRCDVNSKQFRDAMRYVWMPRLLERIQASSEYISAQPTSSNTSVSQIHTDTSGAPNSCVSGSQGVSSSDISGTSMELEAIQLPSNSNHTGCSETQAPQWMIWDGLVDGSVKSPSLGGDFQSFQEDDLFGCGDWQNDGWNEDNLSFLTEQELGGDWRG